MNTRKHTNDKAFVSTKESTKYTCAILYNNQSTDKELKKAALTSSDIKSHLGTQKNSDTLKTESMPSSHIKSTNFNPQSREISDSCESFDTNSGGETVSMRSVPEKIY